MLSYAQKKRCTYVNSTVRTQIALSHVNSTVRTQMALYAHKTNKSLTKKQQYQLTKFQHYKMTI